MILSLLLLIAQWKNSLKGNSFSTKTIRLCIAVLFTESPGSVSRFCLPTTDQPSLSVPCVFLHFVSFRFPFIFCRHIIFLSRRMFYVPQSCRKTFPLFTFNDDDRRHPMPLPASPTPPAVQRQQAHDILSSMLFSLFSRRPSFFHSSFSCLTPFAQHILRCGKGMGGASTGRGASYDLQFPLHCCMGWLRNPKVNAT